MKSIFIIDSDSGNIAAATTKEIAEKIIYMNNYLYHSSESDEDLYETPLKINLIESEDEIPKLPVGIIVYGFVETGRHSWNYDSEFQFSLCDLCYPNELDKSIFIYDEEKLNSIMPKFILSDGIPDTLYFEGAIKTKENESVEEFRNRKYEYFKEEFEKFKKENPGIIEKMKSASNNKRTISDVIKRGK